MGGERLFERGLPHEQAITENPVGRIEDGQGSTARRVVLGQVRPHYSLSVALSMYCQRDNDHGGIKGAHCLHAEKLETHASLHGLPQRDNAGLCGAAELTRLRGQPFALAGELLRIPPGQPNPSATASVGQPIQGELREPQPFWEWSCR
jgi:hypothetical protein